MIFCDSTFSFRTRNGYLHNVNDSGIVFSVSSYGNDFISKDRHLNFIDARNIQKIKIRQKGSVGKGFLIGAGFGFLLGGLLGLSGITEYGLFDKLPAEQNALAGGIVFGIPGLLIGGLAGTYRIKIPIHKSIEKYKSHKEWIAGYVNSKY